MRLSKPRVAPLRDEEMNEKQRALLLDGKTNAKLNVLRTTLRHPDLHKRWLVFGNHVLSKSSLSPRDREILILRAGALCRSGYEFAQHTEIGRKVGLGDDEIARIKQGPDAPGWSDFDRTLLRATDELVGDFFITDETWNALAKGYTTEQLMDLVFTVGQYVLVSMALNTFGVQIEKDSAWD